MCTISSAPNREIPSNISFFSPNFAFLRELFLLCPSYSQSESFLARKCRIAVELSFRSPLDGSRPELYVLGRRRHYLESIP
jgi:hypothetical protein